MTKRKQAYYDKGIKSFFSLKTVASNLPTMLSYENGDTTNSPYETANTLNIFIKYSNKHFSDYLLNETSSAILLKPTDKEEIANIISSLNYSKTSGPKRLPHRILFLIKNEISKQLADILNLSFTTSVSSSVLKTAEVVSVFKKDSKLD